MTKTALAAAAAALTFAAAASAETIRDMPYEFTFQYDAAELSSASGERAVRARLKREAASFCRTKTRAEGVREEARTCTRAVVAAAEAKLAREADAMQLASN